MDETLTCEGVPSSGKAGRTSGGTVTSGNPKSGAMIAEH